MLAIKFRQLDPACFIFPALVFGFKAEGTKKKTKADRVCEVSEKRTMHGGDGAMCRGLDQRLRQQRR